MQSRSSLEQIEAFLHNQLPLSQAMSVSVQHYDGQRLELAAPLSPNRNPHDTAFGGSLYALAVMAGWTLLNELLKEARQQAGVVIFDGRIHYDQVVDEDFSAIAAAPEPAAWRRAMTTFQRYGKARLRLEVVIHSAGRNAVRFEGEYVLQR